MCTSSSHDWLQIGFGMNLTTFWNNNVMNKYTTLNNLANILMYNFKINIYTAYSINREYPKQRNMLKVNLLNDFKQKVLIEYAPFFRSTSYFEWNILIPFNSNVKCFPRNLSSLYRNRFQKVLNIKAFHFFIPICLWLHLACCFCNKLI